MVVEILEVKKRLISMGYIGAALAWVRHSLVKYVMKNPGTAYLSPRIGRILRNSSWIMVAASTSVLESYIELSSYHEWWLCLGRCGRAPSGTAL